MKLKRWEYLWVLRLLISSDYRWNMDAKTIDMKARDVAGSAQNMQKNFFRSIHPDQDSLIFNAGNATYFLDDYLVVAEKLYVNTKNFDPTGSAPHFPKFFRCKKTREKAISLAVSLRFCHLRIDPGPPITAYKSQTAQCFSAATSFSTLLTSIIGCNYRDDYASRRDDSASMFQHQFFFMNNALKVGVLGFPKT
jgi:hypothetical protein